jgi:hypothetical protein
MTDKKTQKTSKTPNSYAHTRYNAMKHGALSRVPVLPWESADEFAQLQEALIQEYKPQGALEEHLVLEIANCIFRKQRLYKAENALIVQRMSSTSSYFLKKEGDFLSPVIDLDLENGSHSLNLKDVLYSQKQYQEQDQDLITHIKYIRDVESIIDADLSYEEMLARCSADVIKLWHDWFNNDDSKYLETKHSFEEFLQTEIVDWCKANLKTFKARPYLKEQLIGRSYSPREEMECLQRHEIALDRRLEKNLAMLLRLQETRKTPSTLVVADTLENSVL